MKRTNNRGEVEKVNVQLGESRMERCAFQKSDERREI